MSAAYAACHDAFGDMQGLIAASAWPWPFYRLAFADLPAGQEAVAQVVVSCAILLRI